MRKDEIPHVTKRVGKSRQVGLHNVNFTPDEIEFMKAVDQYKRDNRRPFPTCSEVLAVLKALGYRKQKEGDETHQNSESAAQA